MGRDESQRADALDRFWDQQVLEETSLRSAEVDAFAAKVIALLAASEQDQPQARDSTLRNQTPRIIPLSPVAHGRPHLHGRMKENSMTAYPVFTSTTRDTPSLSSSLSRSAVGTTRAWPRTLSTVLATAALIAMMLGGLYFGLVGPGSGEPPNTPLAGFAATTPRPQGSPTVNEPVAEWISPFDGNAVDPKAFFPVAVDDWMTTAVANADQVAMQGWRLEPGASTDWPGTVQLTGLAYDVVIEGGYIAVFDGPTVVQRSSAGKNFGMLERHDPGVSIELAVGDVVSFSLSTAGERIQSAFETIPLRFKRVMLYSGSLADLPASNGGTSRIEGQTTISHQTAPFGSEGWFYLLYLRFLRTDAGLIDDNQTELMFGPVAPVGSAENGRVGYVLWLDFRARG